MKLFLPMLLISSIIPVAAQTTATPWDQVNDEERATIEAIGVAAVALHRESPECPEESVSLETINAELSAQLRVSSRQTTDGWGRPLMVSCGEQGWRVESWGADGVLGDDDIVFEGRELHSELEHLVHALNYQRQQKTMASLRSIATVFHAYRIDAETLPGAPVVEMTELFRIETLVAPIYIRQLPLRDAWGHKFLFWHDGENFRVASPGADGVFEADYVSQTGTGSFNPLESERDIVFANESFEQWPDGILP